MRHFPVPLCLGTQSHSTLPFPRVSPHFLPSFAFHITELVIQVLGSQECLHCCAVQLSIPSIHAFRQSRLSVGSLER